jgi:hypothetical protein
LAAKFALNQMLTLSGGRSMKSDGRLPASIANAAEMLDCSPANVRRAIERGDIRAIRLLGKAT